MESRRCHCSGVPPRWWEKRWQVGQHRHTAGAQRARVVGMGAIEDQSQHGQVSPLQGLQAQQGVIEGAETATRHQQLVPPALQLIDLQPLPGQGTIRPAVSTPGDRSWDG